MPKHDLRFLLLHEFKLGHNASKNFININRARERDPYLISQYEDGSKNSVMEMRVLKMKKVDDDHAVLTTKNCKQLFSKTNLAVN